MTTIELNSQYSGKLFQLDKDYHLDPNLSELNLDPRFKTRHGAWLNAGDIVTLIDYEFSENFKVVYKILHNKTKKLYKVSNFFTSAGNFLT